jgi:peptidoglycan hydrolase-like protein with peptidoglycan-binding domain
MQRLLCFALVGCLAACGGPSVAPQLPIEPDAGAPDSGQPDGGAPDAGEPDAGQPDAGGSDAGLPDGGPVDAGALFTDPPLLDHDLQNGDKGLPAGVLQFELKLVLGGNFDEDGDIGPITVGKVKAFQADAGLSQSGVADVATRTALRDRAVAAARALIQPYPDLNGQPFAVPALADVQAAVAAVQVVAGQGDKTSTYNGRVGFSWGDGAESQSLRQGSPAHIDWVASHDTSASQRRVIGVISRNEGPFDAVNSYDAGNYTWGAYQLIGSYRANPYQASDDELSQGLAAIRRLDPEAFFWRFQRYGLDVGFTVGADGHVVKSSVDVSLLLLDGTLLRGKDVWDKVGTTALYNQIFINAGQDPRIQRGEILSAREVHFDALDVVLAAGKAIARKYLTSERAVCAYLDLELNKGRGSATSIYATSIDAVCTTRGLPAADPDNWPEAERAAIEADILQQVLTRAPTTAYGTRMQRVLGSMFLDDAARSYRE